MAAGEANGNWKGGRHRRRDGYVIRLVGTEHHLSNSQGYAYEHRLVAEKKIGRRLRAGELVHHRNGKKDDNRPANLEVLTHEQHGLHHRGPNSNLRVPGERNPLVKCRCGCGTYFTRYDELGRPRSFVRGHNRKTVKADRS